MEKSVELWKTLVKKSIDIINNINYNISINNNKKGYKMSPEELKKLEAEHKKAMEAIEAFNKEMKGLTNIIGEITGK